VLSGPRHPEKSWVSETPMQLRRVEIIIKDFPYACLLQVIKTVLNDPIMLIGNNALQQ